ncbi:MAG: methylmalonyl-CoA mutase family protein [Acidobacteria bacterium]|nr:methylmalonyl-CoA mutase family protein [Acidobacteriota bacterium]MBV9474875.1 methylmalonyl-CoA mutase family protein [Acidobacteriota bacterium]
MSRNEADLRSSSTTSAPPRPPQAREEQLPLFDAAALGAVQHEDTQWRRDVLGPVLTKKPFWKKDYTTVSGMEINPLATPLHVADQDFHEIAYPGQFPYTRGIHPTGYRGRLWTMRQFAGFGTARQTNERFKYLLSQGQTGLSTAFHLPTLYGYDSDHEYSAGEVGKCGVAVDTLADMEVLFDGINLEDVTVSMTINSTAPIALAMYLAVAQKQGADWKKISGTLQNDILKEYIAQKEYIYPPRPSMRLITDTFRFCTENVPKYNTISISGYHIREAGSTALQELAFTLRDGIEYVDYGIRAGLDVDEFAPRLSFFFNSHNDLFEEVAKFRAARRIWAKVMRDRFGAKDPRSLMLRFHTQTAGASLTAQQPYNNIVRVTVQALAAILGGTQSLHTNSLDETLALPTEQAARIALRTQQILAHESGVINTVDPFGGSYFMEELTNKMEQGCFDYFDKIDQFGGMIEAIEAGFPQREIWDASYQFQRSVDSGDKVVVGVNAFQMQTEDPYEILYIDESVTEQQIASLNKIRAERDQQKVQDALQALRNAAADPNANTMPLLIDAVKAYATVGEISDAFRDVFGTYQEPALF